MFASAELINHMNKVKDSYNVNGITQVAGEAALRDRAHFDWLVSSTIAERAWMQEQASKWGWTWPRSSGNFMLFEVGCKELASKLYSRLKENGLLVRYWGTRSDLWTKLRVTVGQRASNQKFVDLVSAVLDDHTANGK